MGSPCNSDTYRVCRQDVNSCQPRSGDEELKAQICTKPAVEAPAETPKAAPVPQLAREESSVDQFVRGIGTAAGNLLNLLKG